MWMSILPRHRMIGEVGSKHMAYLPNVMPCLLHLLNDDTPAVARQAIKTGTTLFAKVLRQLVIQVILSEALRAACVGELCLTSLVCRIWYQGLFSSGGIDDSLKLSWEALLKLKSAVSHMAFQVRHYLFPRGWSISSSPPAISYICVTCCIADEQWRSQVTGY